MCVTWTMRLQYYGDFAGLTVVNRSMMSDCDLDDVDIDQLIFSSNSDNFAPWTHQLIFSSNSDDFAPWTHQLIFTSNSDNFAPWTHQLIFTSNSDNFAPWTHQVLIFTSNSDNFASWTVSSTRHIMCCEGQTHLTSHLQTRRLDRNIEGLNIAPPLPFPPLP